jgi:hypothetical protein
MLMTHSASRVYANKIKHMSAALTGWTVTVAAAHGECLCRQTEVYCPPGSRIRNAEEGQSPDVHGHDEKHVHDFEELALLRSGYQRLQVQGAGGRACEQENQLHQAEKVPQHQQYRQKRSIWKYMILHP